MDATHLIAVVAFLWWLVCAFLAGFQVGDTWRDTTWRDLAVITFWPIFAVIGVVTVLARLPFRDFKDSAAAAGVVSWGCMAAITSYALIGWPSEGLAILAALGALVALPAFLVVDVVVAALRSLFAARKEPPHAD